MLHQYSFYIIIIKKKTQEVIKLALELLLYINYVGKYLHVFKTESFEVN